MQRERQGTTAVETASVVAAAHTAVKAQVGRLNDLNVYPVPDGDTGTNMLLTLQAVLEETSSGSYESLEEACKAVSRAALLGARGNSGVILSQMIRGSTEVLSGYPSTTAEAFAAALDGARERAYSSIREPVEGTMLTVIRDAARAAREALEESAELPAVTRVAAREAHAAVRRTQGELDVLREAGVVDAGGLGVAVILDGLYACVSGEEIEAGELQYPTPDPAAADHSGEEAWGYCTQFVVTGFEDDAGEFEERIHGMGRSVLVVSDDGLVRVHLHTQDPGEALSCARGFGRLAHISVEDMEAQVSAREEQAHRPIAPLAVVAVSRGAGSRELFEGMGAVVVEGGQGENPSAEELAGAVRETQGETVILLPNNKNVTAAAEQVGEIVEAEVEVVPTTSIAAGLAAIVGFDAEGKPDEVAGEMREISSLLSSGEVTRSVRESRVGGRVIPEGSWIGLLNGELTVAEDDMEEATLELAEQMLGEGTEMITLLQGEGLNEEALRGLVREIQGLDAELEVEVHYGGQPMYPLQMVAE